MDVLSHFDTGLSQPFDVDGGDVTFDLRDGRHVLHVLLRRAPAGLRVRLRVDAKGAEFIAAQGLYVSRDGRRYEVLPLAADEDGLAAALPEAGDVFLATRLPYGRDNLDRLLAETRGAALAVRMLGRAARVVPVFAFGEGAAGLEHWFVAGEDAWETAGSWVADAMVRELASASDVARRLLATAAVRIVPLVSPYSATQPAGSYTTLEGGGIYGAATWRDKPPPPEYALVREAVVKAARARRLGLLLTLHSWQGAHDHSGIEFIRTAGGREITGNRLEWAKRTLEALIRDVPRGRAHVAETIWHPGLARDYMLAGHGAVTFRIEITTCGQSYEGFAETARRLLDNTAAVGDWRPALP